MKLIVFGLTLTRSAFVPGAHSDAPVSGFTPISPRSACSSPRMAVTL